MEKKATQVKLLDLKLTDAETGEVETIKSDIYDILESNGNLLRIKNTITEDIILVPKEMVEKFFYEEDQKMSSETQTKKETK